MDKRSRKTSANKDKRGGGRRSSAQNVSPPPGAVTPASEADQRLATRKFIFNTSDFDFISVNVYV